MSSTHQRKRKRAASGTPSSSATTDKVINPLSHTPDTLKQFAGAGYPADLPLPSEVYPGFPHRAPGYNQARQNWRHNYARSSSPPITENDKTDEEEEPNRSFSASDGDDEITDATTQGATDADVTTTDDDDLFPSGSSSRGKVRGRGPKKKRDSVVVDRKAQAYHARVGCLVGVVRRCLAEGDIPTAKRAFGLLARAKVYGRKVDLRYQGLWEMGAEILMREGGLVGGHVQVHVQGSGGGGSNGEEGEGDGGDQGGDGNGNEGGEDEEDEDAKLARHEESLARLKAYYEYLIQQYPFSKQHPSSTNSVLDFQAALFSAEMEWAYAAHRRGLAGLERGEVGDDDDEGEASDAMHADDELMDYQVEDANEMDAGREREGALLQSDDGKDHLRGLSRREIRRREEEDKLRLAAMQRMTDIAQRMDTVMETIPFSRDHELLRLRAMVALYMADLCVPPAPRSRAQEMESREARAGQRRKAREFLERIKEGGGELKEHDEPLLKSLQSDDEGEDEDQMGLPMFSSLGA
jgi:hypothetical protein